ncbi:transglutaminase-like cysteine peptidase [Microvirga sp. W0021]|uniref:Transglutaminase-like cysteine peptidase n=2 Tax=Hohaiivirga grylli TaxID=3133970 RepID=A0ABV0BPM9_9HYPH
MMAMLSANAQVMASLPSPTESIEVNGRKAKPVSAWVDFCNRHAEECAVDTNEAAVITMTPNIWKQLVQVNRKVNRDVKPVTDMDHWGVADKWDLPTDNKGDCEDYQLLKRKLLAEQGLPRRAMRMTVVLDEEGEGHAVLMVRTTQGDYILDNKTSAILPWGETNYVYVKQEGNIDQQWVSLGGVTSPTTTAKN